MSHLVIVTGTTLTATPAVDTQAAMTALGVLAAAGTYDTGPHGTERLKVVETRRPDGWHEVRTRGASWPS